MKPIYLYTMNGIIEATAGLPYTGVHGYPVVMISAKVGKLSIIVPKGVYDRKVADDEKPTFYTC